MSEYPVFFSPEDDGRVSAVALDLPGCVSWGNSRAEARDNIREAIEVWIESAMADRDAIPAAWSSVELVAVEG